VFIIPARIQISARIKNIKILFRQNLAFKINETAYTRQGGKQVQYVDAVNFY
jgi:hypothetical protein